MFVSARSNFNQDKQNFDVVEILVKITKIFRENFVIGDDSVDWVEKFHEITNVVANERMLISFVQTEILKLLDEF